MKKKHPLTFFREARENRLKKMQLGQDTTPFQEYMKIPGAVASDTTIINTASALKPKAKNPKNQKALENAFDKTYGQDRSFIGDESPGETYDEFRRRMGPVKKNGGNTSKYKKGGTIKKKK